MFDDIKDEITIPVPGTGHALNFGKWASAIGTRYNYMRVYIERTIEFEDEEIGTVRYPEFRWTPIVAMKERAEYDG